MSEESDDNETEPLALQLAKDGVESEAAFRAATEAEKARLTAEKEQMKNQSTLEIVLQEIDVAKLMQSIIKAASTAALTGQQAGQQAAQSQQRNRSHNDQSPRSEESSSMKSPLRPDSDEIELSNED
jgi:hypothetical protein